MSLDVTGLLKIAETTQVSRWELDNVTWNERTTNRTVLINFLQRIADLKKIKTPTVSQTQELEILTDLADDMDQSTCEDLLNQDEETSRQKFIEELARQGALETLCNNAVSIETMEKMCKLSPNDFILAAKRSQDLINSIQELVIQGETLSNDVAGA
jgi:hypothetical protein